MKNEPHQTKAPNWIQWLASEDGKRCSNPMTLGPSEKAGWYLENRLHSAFRAGAAHADSEREAKDPSLQEQIGRLVTHLILVAARDEMPSAKLDAELIRGIRTLCRRVRTDGKRVKGPKV